MEIIKRSTIGIAVGGFLTFIVLTIMHFAHIEATVSVIWSNMLASILLGIYFGLASLVYESDRWSPLYKTIIHFSLSIVIYFSIAIPVKWIPFNVLSVSIGILLFIIAYFIYWMGFYLYYKKVEASMNEQLSKKD